MSNSNNKCSKLVYVLCFVCVLASVGLLTACDKTDDLESFTASVD